MKSEAFEKLFFRPIDPFREKCLQSMSEKDSLALIQNYHQEMKIGYQSLAQKKIIVTGLIYNAQQQIPRLQKWFETLKTHCKECHIVIVENNSIDFTRQACEAWQMMDPYHVHLVCNERFCDRKFDIVDNKGPDAERIQKMAFLRNLYVEYISSTFSVDFDHVFVMDFDLQGTLFWDGIFHTMYQFETQKNIDAIACNGIVAGTLLYYDSFAYARDPGELRWTNRIDKYNHDEDVLRYIASEYQSSQELDKVSSAFGGFCIYKFASFCQSKYGFEQNKFTCEHCIFHEKFKNMFVNPNMVFYIEKNIT